MNPAILDSGQLPLCVWEIFLVELIIAPFERRHPEAIKMEHADRDVSLLHPVKERGNSAFVIFRRETGTEPESKGPCRWERWFSGDCGVSFDNRLRVWSVNQVHGEGLSWHRDIDPGCPFRLDFERNEIRSGNEHAISSRGDEEGDVLVSEFGASAAVLIPNLDALKRIPSADDSTNSNWEGYLPGHS